MDPDDPLSAGGSHNGAAAEDEPAHSRQESSQFQTPGTVNSRPGTQTGLPSSPPSTIQRNLEQLAEELKTDDSSAISSVHAKSCNDVREQICSVLDLSFLKLKYRNELLANGPLPKPELDPETLEVLDKGNADISSDDLANANLDVEGAKRLVFKLASIAFQDQAEETATLAARRQSMAQKSRRPTQLGQSRPDTAPTSLQDKVLLAIPLTNELNDEVESAVVDYLMNPTEVGSNLIVSLFNSTSMGSKLDVNTVTCPVDGLHDKSGNFAALGRPKADQVSSFGNGAGSYTIIGASGEDFSSDHHYSGTKKWTFVITDPESFAKKIDDTKERALTEDLNGRRTVEQDNGTIVAVYDLPPETHVGLVIRSKVSFILASQIIGSLENILAKLPVTSEQCVQLRQVALKYEPFTNTSSAKKYHVPSLTQELTVKSLIVNSAYPSCCLHQNLLDELVSVTHRFSASNLLQVMSNYLNNTVLLNDDVLEHRLVVLEEQRRLLIKTQRFDEMPKSFWSRSGIQLTNGVPHFLAGAEFTQYFLLQQAFERKLDGGGNARYQQALTLAIEATTGKSPPDKKSPLEELSAQDLSKVATLISASVQNYGLNCNAPDSTPRDYGEGSNAPSKSSSKPSSGANAFAAQSAKWSGTKGDGRPNRFARGSGGGSGGEGGGSTLEMHTGRRLTCETRSPIIAEVKNG